jgi:hypothetical protein
VAFVEEPCRNRINQPSSTQFRDGPVTLLCDFCSDF